MSKIKARPWDSAEHLKTEEDIAEYFEACLQEGTILKVIRALGLQLHASKAHA